MSNEAKETKFETECAVCKQRFTDHIGSTPCCGAIAYLVKDDGTVSDKITVMASINGGPIAPFLIGEQKSTPLPNDLEQAADKREFYKSVLNDFIELYPAVNLQQRHADMLFKCFDKVSEHALSTLPDLIKKVLERAAENAKIIDFASNYIDHGKIGAQIFEVDKQSILDTKFDDLINLKK